MKGISKLSLKAKMLFGFAVIFIAIVAALAIAMYSLSHLIDVNRQLDDSFRNSRLLIQFRADNTRIRTLLLEAVDADRENTNEILQQLDDELKNLFDVLARIEKGMAEDEEASAMLSEIRELSNRSKELRLQQIDLVRQGRHVAAAQLFRGDSYATYELVYQKARAVEEIAGRNNDELQKRADDVAVNSYLLLSLIGVFVLIVTLIIIIAVFRMITRISKELKEGISVLSTSAAEIQTTVAEISTGATETATAISETSSTVEEIRQTSLVAGQKAKNLLESSQKAADVGEQGLESSQQMVDAMTRIDQQMHLIHSTITKLSEQNRSIGEITSTVADIADQSNLLAVNAAIEAAKAGEHGRGFSVVAQEIRSLSEQSKKSTAQVKEILNEIQKSVLQAVEVINQGTKTASEGNKAVQEDRQVVELLIDSINEAVEAAVQISSSSQQQMAGMDQIVPAMTNIRQASEQNVAGIRQTQEAARSLNELGNSLKYLVERYRL